jgi:hypothetical protein
VPYIIRGSVTARTCDDCIDNLDGATVRFYRTSHDPTLPGRAAAAVKHTAFPRTEEELGQLEGRLLGEGTVGSGGTFTLDRGRHARCHPRPDRLLQELTRAGAGGPSGPAARGDH